MSSDARFAEAVDWIGQSVAEGRAAHAYIVVGAPRGVGMDFAVKVTQLLYGREVTPEEGAVHVEGGRHGADFAEDTPGWRDS